MSQKDEPPAWWALHLRRRGEALTPEEQLLYEAEMSRHDQEAPALKNGLEALRLLREQVVHLASDNATLHNNLARLEEERERVEKALQSSDTPVARRRRVTPMAHPKHDAVRRRYERQCGYCGVSEGDTGGELTVDHFRPISAAGDEADNNLVYCCFRCNTYKGDFWPNASDLQQGYRILHPRLDPTGQHFHLNEQSGCLEPLTPTGRFHIELLRLNRPQLIERRLTARLRHLLVESYRLLQKENDVLRQRAVLLERYLRELASGGMAPADASEEDAT